VTSIGPSITSVPTVGAVETGPTVAFIAVIHLPVDFGFIEVVDEVPTVAASGGGGAVGISEHIERLSADVIYRGESSRMKGTMRAGIDCNEPVDPKIVTWMQT